MATLPIRTVINPRILAGLANGKIPDSALVDIPGQAGGPTVRLLAPAARGWVAMCAAALAAGHVLKATSLYDSYRPFSVQESLFRSRYTTSPIAGASTKTWNGRTWYKRAGVAEAASPGTSNHGKAVAVDVGEERDGDPGTESIVAGTLAWLISNAHLYGYSAELQSEPWHWRWFPGDVIPAAVLAYERGDTMDAAEFLKILKDPAVAAEMRRLPWMYSDPGQPSAHDVMLAEGGEARTAGRGVDTLLARPAMGGGPGDPIDVAALVAALTAPAVIAAISDAFAAVIHARSAPTAK